MTRTGADRRLTVALGIVTAALIVLAAIMVLA